MFAALKFELCLDEEMPVRNRRTPHNVVRGEHTVAK